VAVHRVGKHELNLLSDDRPHQGLVLDCSPLEWAPLERLPPAEEAAAEAAAAGAGPPVWLVLDEVTDPQNLGALVRSAYCLGAAGLLACAKNCAPLSAAATKASAGVLEAWPVHSCNNLARTLADAAERGWTVVGAAAERGAEPCTQLAVTGPTLLVVGSEGHGLRTNVRRACQKLVLVEMGGVAAAAAPGAAGAAAERRVVDSLNVSVATGILLHQLIVAARGPKAAA